MLAQAGLDAAASGVVGPFLGVWLIAAGYLMILALFGVFVVIVRLWNRYRELRQGRPLHS